MYHLEYICIIQDTMKTREPLGSVLGSPTRLRLTRTLLQWPSRRWTGRELARAAGVSTAQAARDLRALHDVGIVRREVHGRSFAWGWNGEHILASSLSRLFQLEANLGEELKREIGKALRRLPIQQARIFGSVARGEERADSDVDLFLKVRGKVDKARVEDALDEVRHRIGVRFGNPVTALVYTAAELAHPINPGLIRSIRKEGPVVEVNGVPLDGSE
jgi:predicted nucleotidyltransferase